jgi:hypothetical protein
MDLAETGSLIRVSNQAKSKEDEESGRSKNQAYNHAVAGFE